MELFIAIMELIYPYALVYFGFDLGRNWDMYKAFYGSLFARITRRNVKGESA